MAVVAAAVVVVVVAAIVQLACGVHKVVWT
jgi:hypothetical protein